MNTNPAAKTADLTRRLDNIIRAGTVAEINLGAATVRVESGGLVTDWLPWLERRAGSTRTWSPPTIGEQCLVLSPGGDPSAGFVLLGLFSDAYPAPSSSADEDVVEYPDGAREVYNHAGGEHKLSGIKTAVVEAATSVSINTPETIASGNTTTKGKLTYMQGMSGSGGAGGVTAVINGNIKVVGGDVTADSIGLKSHKHLVIGIQTDTDKAKP